MIRLVLLFTFLFVGCVPEPLDSPEEPNGTFTGYSADLEVTVIVCDSIAQQSCVSSYPGSGALVALYDNEEELHYGDALNSKVADATGRVQFSGLEAARRYYLRTTYLSEEIESSETTPANGIARHEVWYFN